MAENKPEANKAATKMVPPKPPKMDKDAWLRRGKTSLTLSRAELEQVARLVGAGRVMLNDDRPAPQALRAAMARLGVKAAGV